MRKRDHTIGDGRFRRIVTHMHDRDTVAGRELTEQRHLLRTPFGVDHGGRFVGDQQRGGACERRREGKSLQLAARKRRGLAVGEGAEPDPVEHGVDVDVVRIAQTPHDVVAHADPEHLRLRSLRHERGAARRPETDGTGAIDASGSRGLAVGEDAGQRRLARSVGSDEHDHLGGLNGQRDVTERVGCRAAVSERDVGELDRHRTRRFGCCRNRVGFRRVIAERCVHATQRGCREPTREPNAAERQEEQEQRDADPPIANDPRDDVVAALGRAIEPEIRKQVEQAAPVVADLHEDEVAQIGEHEQREIDDQRGGRPQHQDSRCIDARCAPPATLGGTHQRAEGRARNERGERRGSDYEEPDGTRGDRARDDGAHAVPRRDDGERDDGRGQQYAAERYELTDNREGERHVREDDAFGQLARA